MTLCDTGPLVALVDVNDNSQEVCERLLTSLSAPLVITVPCVTEAFYLAYRNGGWPLQEKVRSMLRRELFQVFPFRKEHLTRTFELMEQYRDVPMDFADASLVAMAEELKLYTIFTLDRHFYAYRAHGKQPFTVVPGSGNG